MKRVILSIASLMLTVGIFAQSPESFTYQAIVRDNNGQPLPNTAVIFQFNILQGSASGTMVYSEEHSATTNDFGLVNLQIGQGTVNSGNFSTIDWGNDSYYLNIQIDQGSGFVDMGTQQFISVPYAMYAKNAGNGGTTYTAGNGISITGNVIENTAPDQTVTITGQGATTVSGTYPNFTISSTDNVDDADADATNELQTLSQTGTSVTLSNGGGTISVADNDNDPTNEIQTLAVSGNQLSISGSGGNTVTMQVAAAGNSGDVQLNDNGAIGADPDLHWDFNNKKFVVGQSTDDGRMIIQQDASAPDSIPILEVKNKLGQTIFVVYPDSVHIFIDDDNTKGVLKGGFAVSGRSGTKALTNDYLLVRPDSTRIWTQDTIAGFGIRNLGGGGETSYMQLTPENYFIGHESGTSLTDGLYNTFFGYKAGMSTTGGGQVQPGEYYGSNNIFIGYESGLDNTTGYNNIFVGYQSGTNNTSGVKNTFIGKSSGSTNTNGGYNTFLGYNSGIANSSGGGNTFVGANCGFFNSTAYYNTLIGTYSGENISTGAYNTYIGSQSGHGGGTPGTYPSTFNTGNYNTAIGYRSGYSNTSGNGNVFIGYQAGYSETGSNKLYIENSNSASPLIYGEFDNDILQINGDQTVTGNSNVSGIYFHITNNPGTGVTPTNYVYQGSSTGSTSKQYAFAINDALWVTKEAWFDDDITCVNLTQTSDKRYKKNITNIDNAIDKVLNLNGVYYYWRKNQFPEKGFDNKRQIGFIAQDLEKVFPELVKTDKQGYKSVNYGAMSAVLSQAIKEQQKIIDNQNKKIEELIKQVDKIKKQLENK